MDESKILILYCGGTLGMVRHPSQGYVPYPGFLTETLRTQSRFHDPNGDSIFSWSDSTERYRAWTEAFSNPASGATSPNRPASPSNGGAGLRNAATIQHAALTASPDDGTQTYASPHLQSFFPSIKVLSSSPKNTFTKNAVSQRIDEHGRLELMLPTMITPRTGRRRTRYAVLEYDPLLDSSNIETKDWLRLAADIDLNYQSFDAFVILHGTDTMGYTSSALSMLLENLGKPVVVTGAQVPLSELRNDAIENVLGALILASAHAIPEVGLFFSSTLFRGNRVSKLSNSTLDAFDSPNMPPLATAGITIQLNQSLILKPRHLQPFRAHDRMSQQVVLLRLFPGLQVDTIASFFTAPIEGVVLHSFGAGNAPTKPELLEVFRRATQERNIVIVNISQCIRGEVSAIYQVGRQLQSVGVVAGGDMTPECALTKLSYLLAKEDLSRDQIRKLMGKSLRGELTERQTITDASRDRDSSIQDASNGGHARRLLESVLNPSSRIDEDMDELALAAEQALLPYLIQRSCLRSDTAMLQTLLQRQTQLDSLPSLSFNGSEASAADSAKQTDNSALRSGSETSLALHIAASLGHTEQVQKLLEAGYLVHSRDYAGNTPLYLAAHNGHAASVEMLRSAGAHLTSEEKDQAHFDIDRRIKALHQASSTTRATLQDNVHRAILLWRKAGLVVVADT